MFEKRACSAIRFIKPYRLWRTIHLAGAIFVFSFISFQVLDLDLSDFPLKEAPGEGTVIMIEAPETTELTNTISEDSFRTAAAALLQPSIQELLRSQQKTLVQHTPYRDTRIRLHRLTIPRSSPSDSSPAA